MSLLGSKKVVATYLPCLVTSSARVPVYRIPQLASSRARLDEDSVNLHEGQIFHRCRHFLGLVLPRHFLYFLGVGKFPTTHAFVLFFARPCTQRCTLISKLFDWNLRKITKIGSEMTKDGFSLSDFFQKLHTIRTTFLQSFYTILGSCVCYGIKIA